MNFEKIKDKRELRGISDDLVLRAMKKSGGDLKKARDILRKYLGVFLTKKVLKGEGLEVLDNHFSAKERDYNVFYKKIFEGLRALSVIDLGCGVNGFSYPYLLEAVGRARYVGVDAVKPLIEKSNKFFLENNYPAEAREASLFELNKIKEIIRSVKERPLAVFLLQVLSALEAFERDFSIKLTREISREMKPKDLIVISFSLFSLSGKNKFRSRGQWVLKNLPKGFEIVKDFEIFKERVLVFKKN